MRWKTWRGNPPITIIQTTDSGGKGRKTQTASGQTQANYAGYQKDEYVGTRAEVVIGVPCHQPIAAAIGDYRESSEPDGYLGDRQSEQDHSFRRYVSNNSGLFSMADSPEDQRTVPTQYHYDRGPSEPGLR